MGCGLVACNYISKDSSSIQYISDARGRTDAGVVYGKNFLRFWRVRAVFGITGQMILLSLKVIMAF